ncbi:MAG: hypothetical protein ACRDRL_22645, partial [Sciscionella sp.]
VVRWCFEERSGPEFTAHNRGEYLLDHVPLTTAGLERINLKPDAIAAFLRRVLTSAAGLYGQPDLRRAAPE